MSPFDHVSLLFPASYGSVTYHVRLLHSLVIVHENLIVSPGKLLQYLSLHCVAHAAPIQLNYRCRDIKNISIVSPIHRRPRDSI